MPWNRRSLLGYSLCSAVQIIQTIVTILVFTTVLILIIELCAFVVEFVSDLEENLRQFNALIEVKMTTAQERIDLTRKLCEIIRFHAEAKK